MARMCREPTLGSFVLIGAGTLLGSVNLSKIWPNQWISMRADTKNSHVYCYAVNGAVDAVGEPHCTFMRPVYVKSRTLLPSSDGSDVRSVLILLSGISVHVMAEAQDASRTLF